MNTQTQGYCEADKSIVDELCPVCRNAQATSPHHIVPRSEGGEDNDKNKVWLCADCHDKVEEMYQETSMMFSFNVMELIRLDMSGRDLRASGSSDKKGHPRLPMPAKEELVELYWGRGVSLRHLGLLYGVSAGLVRDWLERYGVQRRFCFSALLVMRARTPWAPPKPTQREKDQQFFLNLRKGLRQLQCANV